MKYGDYELNVLQEDKVIHDFFGESFDAASVAELESWIAKRLEDTDGEFLDYTQEDIGILRANLKRQLRMLDELDVSRKTDRYWQGGV